MAEQGAGAGGAHVAAGLEFLRRRASGDYAIDEFGFDADLTDRVLLPALRPLAELWFRIEVSGAEHIPAAGAALVVANHAGTIALDALMTTLVVHDHHPARRHLRVLGADVVFGTPVLGELARKLGATLACHDDAARLLAAGELVGVWPEGYKGVGKPFGQRYRLQRFGRGGFVAAALRAGAPIVPCSIVGSEETYPKLGEIKLIARLLGLPYFPVTPTFPWLGLLGAVPLPSKWLISFGAPVDAPAIGRDAADDPALVLALTDEIRERIQRDLLAQRSKRRTAFF